MVSLRSNVEGQLNTAVGAGTLFNNTAHRNTAIGGAAMFSNTTGTFNTAVGMLGLFSNTTGSSNTATGVQALFSNTAGNYNTALGVNTLYRNTTGVENTAVGFAALANNINGSDHTALGRLSGSGITQVSNNIVIGHLSGVHSLFGQGDNRCYIDNIYDKPVNNKGDVARFVFIDPDGKLGTELLNANGIDQGRFPPDGGQRPAVPQSSEHDAVLNGKVEKLQTTVAQQRKQMEVLTIQLKEQVAQIQKVSAQLEASKPAPQVVNNP